MDEARSNVQLPNSENGDENIASFVFTEQFSNVNVDAPPSDISFAVTDSVCSESDGQCLPPSDSSPPLSDHSHPLEGIRQPLGDHLKPGSSQHLGDNSDQKDSNIYPLDDHSNPMDDHSNPLDDHSNPMDDHSNPIDDHSNPLSGSNHPLGDHLQPSSCHPLADDSHPLGGDSQPIGEHLHLPDGSTLLQGDHSNGLSVSSHQLGDHLQPGSSPLQCNHSHESHPSESISHPLGDDSNPLGGSSYQLGDDLQPGSNHPIDDLSPPPSGISHPPGDYFSPPDVGTHPPEGSSHPLDNHSNSLGGSSHQLGDDFQSGSSHQGNYSHPPESISHPLDAHSNPPDGSTQPLGGSSPPPHDHLQPGSSCPIDDLSHPPSDISHPSGDYSPPPDVSTHPPGGSTHCCGLCGRIFHQLVDYLGHRITHAGPEVTTTCELCGIGYMRQTTLRDHYRKKHQVDFSVKQGKTSASPTAMKSSDRQSKFTEINGKCSKLKKNDAKTVHVVITKTDVEDDKFADIEGCSTFDMDRSELLSYNKQEVGDGDFYKEISTGVSGNLDMDGSGVTCMDPDSGGNPDSKKPGHQSLLTIDPEDDFHFVLLKNAIQGNSFKYGKDRFKCLHCDFKSYWRNSISAHMKQLHSDMMSIHQFIEIKPSDSDNMRPEQTIIKMSDYMSSLQVRKVASSVRRIRGIEKQDLPGSFACSKCNKEFGRLRYLRKHMVVHKTDKKYLCDECGKAFKSRSYLKTHYRSHKIKEFRCSQCSFTSTVHTAIHAHRQLHNDDSVICEVCGFAYADKSTLKKHNLVHDPSRPFPCTFPGCTWRFKSEVMCLAHYNAHTTEGKFRCSVCGYVFRHKHHLQRHQNKMHGITSTGNVTIGEDDAKLDAKMEAERLAAEVDLHSTVNLIVESQLERDQLENALQSGQLIIATDDDGNAINYEVADITMSVTYHTLSEDDPA